MGGRLWLALPWSRRDFKEIPPSMIISETGKSYMAFMACMLWHLQFCGEEYSGKLVVFEILLFGRKVGKGGGQGGGRGGVKVKRQTEKLSKCLREKRGGKLSLLSLSLSLDGVAYLILLNYSMYITVPPHTRSVHDSWRANQMMTQTLE